MVQEAVFLGRSLTSGSFPNAQTEHPIPEPHSVMSRLVAFISHDLRQPLTAILANAEFLTRPNISEMERIDFYQEIRWDVDRINELVSSLLECSKGRDSLQLAVGNIATTVERAIRMICARQEFLEQFIETFNLFAEV
jgi:signal transduction histidine kinase